MRSITYILGGKPSNTYDCLDHSLRHKAQRIILTLRTLEEAQEEYIVRWLKASLVWFFDDVTAAYESVLGGCFMHESAQRQRLSVDNANLRLEQELKVIRSKLPAVPIEGPEQRFDSSVTYKEI
jgi:hypothetical protein